MDVEGSAPPHSAKLPSRSRQPSSWRQASVAVDTSSPARSATWRCTNTRIKHNQVARLGSWGGLAFFFGSFCLLRAGYITQIACRLRELEQASDSPS
jgi:hypothetical protein